MDVPPGERTLPALLERGARAHGSRTLLCAGGRSLSFGEVRDLAAGRAGSLAAAGIGRGDRVAVISENRLEVL